MIDCALPPENEIVNQLRKLPVVDGVLGVEVQWGDPHNVAAMVGAVDENAPLADLDVPPAPPIDDEGVAVAEVSADAHAVWPDPGPDREKSTLPGEAHAVQRARSEFYRGARPVPVSAGESARA